MSRIPGERAEISAEALFTLLYVAMGNIAFTSMLTKEAQVGLAKDLNDSIFEHMGIDSTGRWVER